MFAVFLLICSFLQQPLVSPLSPTGIRTVLNETLQLSKNAMLLQSLVLPVAAAIGTVLAEFGVHTDARLVLALLWPMVIPPLRRPCAPPFASTSWRDTTDRCFKTFATVSQNMSCPAFHSGHRAPCASKCVVGSPVSYVLASAQLFPRECSPHCAGRTARCSSVVAHHHAPTVSEKWRALHRNSCRVFGDIMLFIVRLLLSWWWPCPRLDLSEVPP